MHATSCFREHLLFEGAEIVTDSMGLPLHKLVYGLLDPEEIVIPANTTQAVTALKAIIDEENSSHLDPATKFTSQEVIIGDPNVPATAQRMKVKDIRVNSDGTITLSVAPNVHTEKIRHNPRRYPDSEGIAYGQTGDTLAVQRMIPGYTHFLEKATTYVYTPGEYPVYVVGIDPRLYRDKKTPGIILGALLKTLLNRK